MTTIATTSPTGLDAPRATGRRVGLGLHAVVGAFLLFDAAIHVLDIQPVRDAMATLGYVPGAAVVIGVVELVCVALYLVPRTAVLGAVLLTGYLGGAVAAQLRIEAPLFSTLLFPVYLGTAMWAGLWLRDTRVRRLLERPAG